MNSKRRLQVSASSLWIRLARGLGSESFDGGLPSVPTSRALLSLCSPSRTCLDVVLALALFASPAMSEILPCPFTAGGCPLFNIQPGADPVQTSCHGGCSPAPAPAAVSVSDKQTQTQQPRAIPLVGHQRSESAPSSSGRQHPLLPTPPTIAYDTFGDYDSISSSSTSHRSSSGLASGLTDALLFGELSLPTGGDNSLEALNVGEPWNALDLAPYGVSPGQLEVPPYWSTQSAAGSRPFATGSASSAAAVPSAAASSSATAPTAKHGLWDIEELVSYEGPRAKRSRRASPPPPLSSSRPKLEPIPVVMSPGSMAVGDSGPDQASQLPTPPSLSSPPSSPEESEHITVRSPRLGRAHVHP